MTNDACASQGERGGYRDNRRPVRRKSRLIVRNVWLRGANVGVSYRPTKFQGARLVRLVFSIRCIVAAIGLFGALAVAAAELPIFDAHIHYSHDAWEIIPPDAAIAILRTAGLKRALVSSSGDAGTRRLAAAAPDLVIPSLRPYRTRGDAATWVRDDSVIAF